jgi:hypothetical protein
METFIEELVRMEAELASQVVYKTYTYGELSKAFDAVKNPNDWKAEIAAFMPGDAVMVVVSAIEFFTATQPVVRLDTRTMRYLVISEGYRNGPAGDH